MSKQCRYCDHVNEDTSTFCRICGKKLTKLCRYCNNENEVTSVFCRVCGKKLSHMQSFSRKRKEKEVVEGPKDLDQNTIRTMLIGFVATIIIILLTRTNNFFLCLPRIALGGLSTLCHEFGHSFFACLFGCPSFPAFDFKYGGGIAIIYARSSIFMGIIYLLFGLAIWFMRKNRFSVSIIVSILVLHIFLAFTKWHQVLILLMGHGGELVFATLFLYRAWTNYSTFHEQERIAYSLTGFFLMINNMLFSYRLFRSAEARMWYGLAKGGGHWMDFDRIAKLIFGTTNKLPTVSFFFCILCFLPILVSYLLFRYEYYINKLLKKITHVELS